MLSKHKGVEMNERTKSCVCERARINIFIYTRHDPICSSELIVFRGGLKRDYDNSISLMVITKNILLFLRICSESYIVVTVERAKIMREKRFDSNCLMSKTDFDLKISLSILTIHCNVYLQISFFVANNFTVN